jgi:hypothetical protein
VLPASLFALELVLPAWAASVILGAVLLIGAWAAVPVGVRRMKELKVPAKTMQTVKEDALWIKEQPRS